MPEEDQSKPPAEWLNRLHEAGHWERLIEVGSRSLAADPNDPETHRHLAWAYAKTSQEEKMKGHLDFLLNAEPEEDRNHHLAAIYHLKRKRHKDAKPHVDFLLQHHPRNATYRFVASIYALRANKVAEARAHIREARSICPEWAPAAHLEIEIDGISQSGASDAWERVRRLKESLALDPQNAAILTSIGSILLAELEQPKEAEQFFRQSLSIEPSKKDVQRKLLDSIRSRSLFYRTLSLPISATRAVGSWESSPGRVVLLFIAFKAVIAFLLWLIATGLLFAPAAKIYEWFVLVEVTQSRGLSRFAAPLAPVLRWPFWLRLAVAFSIIMGGWVLLFYKVFAVRPGMTFQWMTIVFGFHFIVVSLFVGLRKLQASLGSWWNDRRHKKRQKLEALEEEAA